MEKKEAFLKEETLQKECGQELPLHTFAVCAYKDSPYLEECIRSLKAQERVTDASGTELWGTSSEIICCTSTPSPFIRKITEKYQIPLYVREGESNIREDWLFAYRKARGRLVTIAHQDDVYRKNYAVELKKAYRRYPDLLVFVSDYLTLKMQQDGTARAEALDTVRLVKKLLRMPLRLHALADRTWVKKSSVLFGNSLCCPACTYHKALIGEDMFHSEYEFALDWDNLYELAGKKGRFYCVEKPLLAYRVHEGATTKACIEDNRRSSDETAMFRKMWPDWAVRLLMHFYKKAYKEYE
ncbi:MAG: glycosyltransferase family 2 protein [Clostridiaceae bacterium]|nr:glycosyltransferase family 2 protein [Clostridiaceae bacterium]MDD6074466.1 glycosyltransferase family 2 protein [Clostridium sp.]